MFWTRYTKNNFDFWEFTSERPRPNVHEIFPGENATCLAQNLKNVYWSSSKRQNGSKNEFLLKKKPKTWFYFFYYDEFKTACELPDKSRFRRLRFFFLKRL